MHMTPDYHQLEFDLRLYLTHLDCVRDIAARSRASPADPTD
jgi:hypothetical protein